jgi:quercetin dioxygenase-like cupin family protein
VTPTVFARGTFDAFKVKSASDSPVDFKAKAKSPIDVVVRRHDYAVGSTTGRHSHPGPVFITVTQRQLTYYEYERPELRAARGVGRSGVRRQRARSHRAERVRGCPRRM